MSEYLCDFFFPLCVVQLTDQLNSYIFHKTLTPIQGHLKRPVNEKAGPQPEHAANTVGFVVLKGSSGEMSGDTKSCGGKVCMIQELN